MDYFQNTLHEYIIDIFLYFNIWISAILLFQSAIKILSTKIYNVVCYYICLKERVLFTISVENILFKENKVVSLPNKTMKHSNLNRP